MAVLPAGVYGDSDLDVNQGQFDFMAALRYLTPQHVRIYITSATRSPYRQALAMLVKLEQAGPQELYKTYANDQIVSELLNAARDANTWAGILQKYANQGIYMSRHMRGDALDIRTRDISSSDVNAIINAAKQLGAKTLLEGVPPHLHVDSFANAKTILQTKLPKEQAQEPAKKDQFELLRLSEMPRWAVATLGASVSLLLIAVAVRVRKKRAIGRSS